MTLTDVRSLAQALPAPEKRLLGEELLGQAAADEPVDPMILDLVEERIAFSTAHPETVLTSDEFLTRRAARRSAQFA